jgi:hypothetical protein
MATRPKNGDAQAEEKAQVSTSKFDHLERLANAAAQAAQAKQWRARKNGMSQQDEPSVVRNLNHDAEAKAQAEAAMQQMMAKSAGKRRSR